MKRTVCRGERGSWKLRNSELKSIVIVGVKLIVVRVSEMRAKELEERMRIQKLQEEFITDKVAILAPEKLGLSLTTFVSIKTSQHSDKWLKQFSKGVRKIPEVVEFYRLSGDIDYLLKVVVADVADYDRVYKKIISAAPLSDVSSSFAMERIKCTTALPL